MWITEIYRHNHRLSKLAPAVRALYWAPAMVLALISTSVAFNWSMFAIINLLQLLVCRIQLINLIRLYRIPIVFLLIGCILLVLEISPKQAFLSIGKFSVGISPNGVQLATILFSRSLALIGIMYFILLTNTISEIAVLMKQCRIPVLFIDLFVVTFKFIENLRTSCFQMFRAQKCRLGYSGKLQRLPLFVMLMATVFQQSMQKAKQLETAMQARCVGDNYCFLQEDRPFFTSQLLLPASMISGAAFLLLICSRHGW